MTRKISAPNKRSQPATQKAVAERTKGQSVDWEALLAGLNRGKSVLEYGANRNIFLQGQPADSVFYLRRGKVKLSVTSQQGKEAIVAILERRRFLRRGMPRRSAVAHSNGYRGDRLHSDEDREARLMTRMLHEQHDISELFVTHLLSRNIRFEADLVDQLFNSSEKRLARILLLLSHFGKESRAETVLPRINQEHLAQMVGTTRSRVSHFMNKFKELGFIDYKNDGELTVHSGLLSVVLHD